MTLGPHAARDAVLVAMLIVAVVTDTRSARIPNVLTFAGMAIGLGLAAFAGTTDDLKSSALGLLISFFLFWPFFALGMVGGGDAKLFMAIGALEGWAFTLDAFLWYAVASGVLSVLVMVLQMWGNPAEKARFLAVLATILITKSAVNPDKTAAPRRSWFRFSYAIAIGTGIAFFRSGT